MTTEELILAMEPNMAGDKAVTEAAALTSIAISLKRIADRLEKITTVFGDGSMGQLNVGCEGNINVSNSY